MRKSGIGTIDQANEFLATYLITHNRKFAVAAAEEGTAFVPYRGTDLETIFSKHHERVVGNDNNVILGKLRLQIERQTFRFGMAKCRVLVCEHLDGTISVHYGPHLLGTYASDGQRLAHTKERAA